MPASSAWHLERFDCGHDRLDRWLQGSVGHAQRRDLARTYVAVDDTDDVFGYCT